MNSFIEQSMRLLELGALAKIVHVEKDDKGNITSASLNPGIKSGVKMFGLGKGEEALYQRIMVNLKNEDQTPDGAAQKEINGWFATLKPWQKVEFQMTLGSLVDQSDQITAATAFLRSLVLMGNDKDGDKRRTKYCIQSRFISKKPPWWHKAGQTIQEIFSDDWPKKLLKEAKEIAKSGKIEVENLRISLEKTAEKNDIFNKLDDHLTKRKERLVELNIKN